MIADGLSDSDSLSRHSFESMRQRLDTTASMGDRSASASSGGPGSMDSSHSYVPLNSRSAPPPELLYTATGAAAGARLVSLQDVAVPMGCA